MKIACVNQDPGIAPDSRKGAAVHLAAMRRAFAECGAQVVPLDESDDAALRVALETRARDVDLIYERYAIGKTTACAFARDCGLPHVLEINAPLLDEARLFRGRPSREADLHAEQFLFANSACVLAVSSQVAQYARSRGAPPGSLLVRPNGVDATRFHPRGPEERVGIVPAGRIVVGFHGRLRPWHGFELLVAACAELEQRGRPVHLLVVGRGDFARHVAGRLKASCWSHVDWQPHDAVGRYVACFDVLPLCYGAHGPHYFSPLKLLEAMASGVVPVVPDVGDLARVVDHGRNGLLYPVGDLAGLVTCIETLVDSRGLRPRLARAAVATARECSWRSIAMDVLARALPGERCSA